MRARVRIHPGLRNDLRAQLAWLAELGEDLWIERLRHGLEEARRLLEAQPRIGALEGSVEGSELRRLVLREVPYILWYSVHDRGQKRPQVWALRLFHARQRRPKPTWPGAP